MSSSLRRTVVIIFVDLLIALFAFWFSRYFGGLPRWYWLVLISIMWVILSACTGKLSFSKYKRMRYAFGGIFLLNILIGSFLFFLYRSFVSDYKYDYSILLAGGIITLLEWMLYYAVRLVSLKKMPYFYEEPIVERDVEKIRDNNEEQNIENEVVKKVIDYIKSGTKDKFDFEQIKISKSTKVLDVDVIDNSLNLGENAPSLVVHKRRLNRVRHINTLLATTNEMLEDNGYVVCRCVTAAIRCSKIKSQMPIFISGFVCVLDYIFNRVIPKLVLTERAYYLITRGVRRSLTRVEILGRIYRAGYEVVCENIVGGEFFVIAQKVKDPIRDDKPSSRVLIRLKRKGKDGKIIGVYKFRTMHAYSEYLQPYLYKTGGLSEGGKFADDFRVSTIGKILRKTWLDELPMILNLIKGNLKIVGVRPLSSHYFSLYSKELQELRIKVKPGLLPPFYADMPKTLEDIETSEIRYIRAYLNNPIKTDWIYFWKCVRNIVFKGERSK